MKKQLLFKRFLGLMVATIIPVLIQSQVPLVNGGFEAWNSRILFEHPTGWFTDVNPGSAPLSTIKDSDAQDGNYSLKLTTVDNTDLNNPVPVGYAVLGEFIYEFPPKGIPWSQLVDKLNMDIKYNIGTGDAGLVWVRMTKNSEVVSNTFYTLTGSQSTWSTLSINLNFAGSAVAPDSIMIGIASSIPEELNFPIYKPVIGSWVMIDDLHFSYNGSLYPVPNFSFENWEDYAVEEADGWTSSNLLMTYDETTNMVKTTDAASGTYAVQLTTASTILSTVPTPGRLSYGSALLRAGGVPYTDTPRYLTGEYKYSPSGSDEAIIEVYFNQNPDNWLTGNQIDITGTSDSYQKFTLPINFPVGSSPDIIFVNVYSGANIGSVLKVDNLQLTNVSTGIEDPEKDSPYGLYPNPFNEVLYLKNPQNIKRVTLSSMSGQVVLDIMTLGAQQSITTGHLAKGQYLITLETNEGQKISEIMMRE